MAPRREIRTAAELIDAHPIDPNEGFATRIGKVGWLQRIPEVSCRIELSDPACPGLSLRIDPDGTLSFRWFASIKLPSGKRKNHPVFLGEWNAVGAPGKVNLDQAKANMVRAREAHKAGRLPEVEADIAKSLGTHRELIRIAETAMTGHTVEYVAKHWFERRIVRKRLRPEHVRTTLDKYLAPSDIWRMPITAVDELQLGAIVEGIVDQDKPAMAMRVLAHIKQMWRYAQGRGFLRIRGVPVVNPASVLVADDLGCEIRKRRRVLSDDEIREFWTVLADPPTFAREGGGGIARPTRSICLALRLLLLLGLRQREIRAMRWEWIDLDKRSAQGEPTPEMTVPVHLQKGSVKQKEDMRDWIVPLPRQAVVLLRELRALAGDSPWVLPSSGGRGKAHGRAEASKTGHVMGSTLPVALRSMFGVAYQGDVKWQRGRAHPILHVAPGRDPYRPHDLRRTLRTRLPDLDVVREVAERCLNHRLPGMEEIYNQNDYLRHRRAALQAWADRVEEIATGGAPNVAPLRPSRPAQTARPA